MPGASRVYVAVSVPTMAAISATGPSLPSSSDGPKPSERKLYSALLGDPDPGQPLPPPRQLVAAVRELLLRLEQLEPRCEPLFTCPGHVLRHRLLSFLSGLSPAQDQK